MTAEVQLMIEIERRGTTAILRMMRGKGNSLNLEFCQAIDQGLQEVEASDARALVITGEASVFSAGVDLVSVARGGREMLADFLPGLTKCFRSLAVYPKPVVAAVNGHAIAGGCILVLASDYRVMSQGKATIGLTEMRVGVPFPTMAFEMVRFAVPPQHLQELIYTAQTYRADEALRRGLVDEAVPSDRVLDRACEMADQLGAIPPETFRLTKQHLRAPLLDRIDRYSPTVEPHLLDHWSAPETLAKIEQFVSKTIKAK